MLKISALHPLRKTFASFAVKNQKKVWCLR
jgi:hypothetical protein